MRISIATTVPAALTQNTLEEVQERFTSISESKISQIQMELPQNIHEPINRSRSLSLTDANDCSNLWNEDEVVKMDLYTACSIGQYSCVQQHLADGVEIADLDKHNCGGWTPLMYAAYVGHDNIVNLLLDFSVDVNARTTKNGATPLMLAASCGNQSVVYFLLQNNAKINDQDRRGWTGLFYATFQGHLPVVKLLLEAGADKELREHKMGLTPLLAAAREGHEVIFEVLLRSNANLKARTNLGEDARSLALWHGHMAVANIIDHQSFQHQPNYLLRSEPGLSPDDSGLNGGGVDDKVYDWLQVKNNIPTTGIRHGPEAFAKLISNKRKEGEPVNIPSALGRHDKAGHVVGSPYYLSVTPNTPEGNVGSYEEHFFINCGRTVESASLHKQLQKMNALETETNRTSQDHDNRIPPTTPTVASFLQELKLTKYLSVFEEQDVDFSTLLTLTDNDLKEVGISLFGPRRKIFTALTRWKEEHSQSNPDRKAMEKLKFQACQAEMQLRQATSEVQQLQTQLIQEKDLRLVVEGCLMEEKAKRKEIYTRVCKLQEHWKRVEGEVEVLKALNQDMEKYLNLSEISAKELYVKMQNSIVNLGSFVQQGAAGNHCILFGHKNPQSENSSESSGNSSS